MNKRRYYIIGIFLIIVLSICYLSHLNLDVNEKVETDLNLSYETLAGNYTDGGNQTPIKNISKIKPTNITIRGETSIGELPIFKNFGGDWLIRVVFDSNITENEAKEIISRYEISKPNSIGKGHQYPRYYINVSRSDFENIKKRLDEEDYVQLSKKIKITGDYITVGIWISNDEIVPGLISNGIPLRETMVMDLIYGPETPGIESKNIMEQLDRDEKIINTNIDYFFK